MTQSNDPSDQRQFSEFTTTDADTDSQTETDSHTDTNTTRHSESDPGSNTRPESRPNSESDGTTHATDENHRQSQPTHDDLPELSSESFTEHWFEQTAKRNAQENHPERNDPGHSWPVGRVEPHQLGNCHRKWFYQWLNAPKESPDPHGIFAMGHFIEEDVIEPWLADTVEPTYEIRNAIHVTTDVATVDTEQIRQTDPEPSTDSQPVTIPDSIQVTQPQPGEPVPAADADSLSVRIAGSTDPAVCDPETDEIVALTEVKSTGSLNRITEPKRRHLLQIHAYLKALDIETGYFIYVDRDELLDPKVFEVTFDEAVWERVTDWAMDTLPYALNGELPPADPPQSWMCDYCEYQNRCGKGRSNLGGDMGVTGFVPGLSKYPKHMVVNHLEAHPEVGLTPTLASTYPELTDEHHVVPWACPRCDQEFDHTDDHFQSFEQQTGFETPYCPVCEEVFDKQVYLEL